MIRIVNLETGEVIERELNAQEIAQRQIDEAAELAHKAEIQAKATAKAALLTQLGITAEQAKLLLS
jgi:hypothetical protein